MATTHDFWNSTFPILPSSAYECNNDEEFGGLSTQEAQVSSEMRIGAGSKVQFGKSTQEREQTQEESNEESIFDSAFRSISDYFSFGPSKLSLRCCVSDSTPMPAENEVRDDSALVCMARAQSCTEVTVNWLPPELQRIAKFFSFKFLELKAEQLQMIKSKKSLPNDASKISAMDRFRDGFLKEAATMQGKADTEVKLFQMNLKELTVSTSELEIVFCVASGQLAWEIALVSPHFTTDHAYYLAVATMEAHPNLLKHSGLNPGHFLGKFKAINGLSDEQLGRLSDRKRSVVAPDINNLKLLVDGLFVRPWDEYLFTKQVFDHPTETQNIVKLERHTALAAAMTLTTEDTTPNDKEIVQVVAGSKSRSEMRSMNPLMKVKSKSKVKNSVNSSKNDKMDEHILDGNGTAASPIEVKKIRSQQKKAKKTGKIGSGKEQEETTKSQKRKKSKAKKKKTTKRVDQPAATEILAAHATLVKNFCFSVRMLAIECCIMSPFNLKANHAKHLIVATIDAHPSLLKHIGLNKGQFVKALNDQNDPNDDKVDKSISDAERAIVAPEVDNFKLLVETRLIEGLFVQPSDEYQVTMEVTDQPTESKNIIKLERRPSDATASTSATHEDEDLVVIVAGYPHQKSAKSSGPKKKNSKETKSKTEKAEEVKEVKKAPPKPESPRTRSARRVKITPTYTTNEIEVQARPAKKTTKKKNRVGEFLRTIKKTSSATEKTAIADIQPMATAAPKRSIKLFRKQSKEVHSDAKGLDPVTDKPR